MEEDHSLLSNAKAADNTEGPYIGKFRLVSYSYR